MRAPELAISREKFDAVILNLDGVVTRSTNLHINAWKRLFEAYLHERSSQEGEDYRYFDIDHDYHRYVDGRPRYQAVKHFLLARHIDLPMGEPDDPPDSETVCGLGNRKNLIFNRIVDEEGVEVYGCAIALVHRFRKVGIKTAVVSASTHCDLILKRADIADLFDTRVDGTDAERLALDSKPDPDIFLEAARRLGVTPAKTVVLEDTVVGVTAGARGRFALVIGVDRGDQAKKMREHGADFVLEDLCAVDIEGTSAERRFSFPKSLTDMTLVSKQLTGKRPALFLDYGGTLAPIVDRPEDAGLSDHMRLVLSSVARLVPIVVVSGRDLEDVSRLVGLHGITYAGSHGLEIGGPSLNLELPEGANVLEDLDKAARDLGKALEAVPGTRLERKRFALVVHCQAAAAADPGKVRAVVEGIQARYPRLHLTGGKEVIEVLPDIDWDKGRAVRWLLSELDLDGPDVLPIYIGDDETDEDAFRVVRGHGLGILVSDRPQPSAATYRVKDPYRVAALLRHLEETQRVSNGSSIS
jgi:trehalose 6-phosphate phosphatase